MIRALKESDIETVIDIVNENWKTVYKDYVNPALLNDVGCKKRADELEKDFHLHRLSEYVWDEDGQVLAMLSIGDTADSDKMTAFEIWRIYITPIAQRRGIGRQLLSFAKKQARDQGYKEIVIWAFKENVRALAFYQKHGYVIDKEVYLEEPYLTDGVRLIKKI